MNAMRDKYAREAEDEYNAYRLREDGPEGFYYSDKTISRALRELEKLNIDDSDIRQREYMQRMLREHGPRRGVGYGLMYPQSYEGGRMDFIDEYRRIQDMDDIGRLDKLRLMGRDGLNAAMYAPDRRRGYASGLFTYLFGDRDELY
jgi:hypothetical protein